MKEIGFDSEKYLKIQSEKIAERIKMFDNKVSVMKERKTDEV